MVILDWGQWNATSVVKALLLLVDPKPICQVPSSELLQPNNPKPSQRLQAKPMTRQVTLQLSPTHVKCFTYKYAIKVLVNSPADILGISWRLQESSQMVKLSTSNVSHTKPTVFRPSECTAPSQSLLNILKLQILRQQVILRIASTVMDARWSWFIWCSNIPILPLKSDKLFFSFVFCFNFKYDWSRHAARRLVV